MALTDIDLVSVGTQKYFDKLNVEFPEIDKLLFPIADIQDASAVDLSEWGDAVVAARTVSGSDASNTTSISQGRSVVVKPATLAEKIKIDPQAVLAGIRREATNAEITQEFMIRSNRLLRAMIVMARNKAAIDVLLAGEMVLTNKDSNTNVIYDYGRAAANTIAYDTTSGAGKSFDDAVAQAMEVVQGAGANMGQIGVLVGSRWLEFLTASAGFEKKAQYATFAMPMDMPLYPGWEGNRPGGLAVVGRYQVDGKGFPITIMTYSPRIPYKRSATAAVEPYVPANQFAVFPMGVGVRHFRSVGILLGNNSYESVPGEIVVDGFVDSDPAGEWIRAQSRPFYSFSDINQTAAVVGTFA